ncbi:MAG: TfoX/Sxy family DNA transformation protein, partial [Eubacterium sp.]
YEQLKTIGSKQALLMLREKDPGACLHELTGLEGAIQGVRKYNLPDEVKQDLKDWFNTL